MKRSIGTAIGAMGMIAGVAVGQSNLSTVKKLSWSENCGWMNWRDAGLPAGMQGVVVRPGFLSGFAWCENIGWINLGDGVPADAVAYGNTTGSDFGVNIASGSGQLSGMAWSENAGWINFGGGALAGVAFAARHDAAARRLRGYAWGENIGWINFDDSTSFVGTCIADFNTNGQVTVQDLFDFLAEWFALQMTPDVNASGGVSVQDIFDFLALWFAGCV